MYDLDYGTGGADASTPLTVKSDGDTSTPCSGGDDDSERRHQFEQQRPAATSTAPGFSSALLASLQNLSLGG